MNALAGHEDARAMNAGLQPWRADPQLDALLARRRVLAPLVRALRELSLGAPTSLASVLAVFDATMRHPELVHAVGKFIVPIEAARTHLRDAYEERGPFRRRELAELCARLEGLSASPALEEHDEALAYWSTAGLRWAVRTERPVDDMLLSSLMRIQGANEHVDVLIAHVCRDPHRWLEAMRCFGRIVHRTGPLARRGT